MASSSNNDSSQSDNTTFVQVHPSNFRTIVQKLTGAPDDDPSTQKLPLTHPTRYLAPKKPAFKLCERRRGAKNLKIKLKKTCYYYNNNNETTTTRPQKQPNLGFCKKLQQQQRGSSVVVFPVSTLDFIEEERVISERGFYLHPSPFNTPRSGEPELLALFPLHSPRDNVVVVDDDDDCTSSPS